MSISQDVREQVRQRADFACEYCGVTETGTAGQLTLDHFHPQSKGGGDDLENLLYCCHRCNEYKSDYWPHKPEAPALWNPRREAAAVHFVELADGRLYATGPTGAFTLNHLRLNRPPLVAFRLRRRQSQEEQHLLTRLRDIGVLVEQLHRQQTAFLEEHRALLQEQLRVLKLLLDQQPPGHG